MCVQQVYQDPPETFVLVHGAGRTGQSWDRTAVFLRRMGHTVHAPTMAGVGPGAEPGGTMPEAVDSLVAYVMDSGLENVVLVGHSLGGVYVSQALPRLQDRVKRAVFMSAFVLLTGESPLSTMPQETQDAFRDLADEDGMISMPFRIARERYLGDLPLVEAQASWEEMWPQSLVSIDTPVNQDDFYAMVQAGFPVSYIEITGDVALPKSEAYSWVPRFFERLGPLARFTQILGSSHSTTHVDPVGTAEAIVRAGRD